jgi:tetratricopeptide (TPR) repeat protein
MSMSGSFRVITCCALAVALLLPAAGCGTKKKGKKGLTIAQLKEKAEKESSPDRKAAAYLKIAAQQFGSGDKTGAKASANQALDALVDEDGKPAGEANKLAPRIVEVADTLALVGDKKQARKALETATADDYVNTIEDTVAKTEVFAEAGGIYGDKAKGIGDSGKAKELLAKANEVAAAADERFRADALAAVALGYTRSGLAKEAGDMVNALVEAARGLEQPKAKAEALAAAANVKAQTGKKDEAKELLTEAAEVAKSDDREDGKAIALIAIAIATEANGDVKKALSLLKEADKAANKVGDNPDTQKMLVDKVNKLTMEFSKK